MTPIRLALVGCGLVGKRHLEVIKASPEATLVSIADPSDEAQKLATDHGVFHGKALTDVLSASSPDAVILATPNAMHLPDAETCIAAGLPVLVEKPLTDSVAAGERLVEAAQKASVPVLTGHHRRHHSLVRAAKDKIDEGALGKLVTAHATTWLMKPDHYFDVEWRRAASAGPVSINLIHDVDLLRHFCGDVVEVHAFASNTTRGFDAEDSASIILRFASGALGTMSLTDSVPAPWSWELTAKENPAYPPNDEICMMIGGTRGALEIPAAAIWSCPEERSWWAPIARQPLFRDSTDPFANQLAHFCSVIRGDEEPRVTAQDGLAALKVIEAVKMSARTGQTVKL